MNKKKEDFLTHELSIDYEKKIKEEEEKFCK